MVVPRVRLAPVRGGGDDGNDDGGGGEALPVEDRVRSLLRRGVRGLVTVSGPPGSGKTTALRHLAAVLPAGAAVGLCDEVPNRAAWRDVDEAAKSHLVICTARPDGASSSVARLTMAPWGNDDVIEYLLARHPQHCRAVMRRVQSSAAAHLSLDGSPELWRLVLDAMAADASIADVSAALRRCLGPALSDPKMTAGALCLAALRDPNLGDAAKVFAELAPPVRRLVGLRPVQVALASELIVRDLCDGVNGTDLEGDLPHDLVLETARLAAHWPAAVDELAALVGSRKRRVHPMAASVLLAARPDWRPGGARVPTLKGAYVAGAHWAGVDLHGSQMAGAHLDHADLSVADLHDACVTGADLRRATLRGACLAGVRAASVVLAGADLAGADVTKAKLENADLRGADLRAAELKGVDLTGADLAGACLANANLREAILDGTRLAGADLAGADLSCAFLQGLDLSDVNLPGASFSCAHFTTCEMEGISLPNANFAGAQLKGCYLTGASMARANFRQADLRNAGLADVDWEEVDLREADLRGASFHLGSTRSGLVGSATPGEGSRTGFYTDDFQDRDFKNPDEIRKANLRGADLRGARMAGVDFYLVDVRGARYTAAQAEHLRRCGAIMDDA